jgi:excisionase family DNA binding protein
MSGSSRQNTAAPDAESRYRPTPAAADGGTRPALATTGRKAPRWPPTHPTDHPHPCTPSPPTADPGGQPEPGGPLDQLPEVLKVPEAAAILRVGRNQLYAAVARGEVPAIRIGRTIRIPKAPLADLLTAPPDPAAASD